MTTFEHAMLGMSGVIGCGLHQRFGWKLAALAGVAAIAPDWDALPLMFSEEMFFSGHRVWGHNIFACVFVGIIIALLDYRFDLMARLARPCQRWLPRPLEIRNQFQKRERIVWIAVAVVAALSQIPADMAVSGTEELPDWPIKIFWPISQFEASFPLVYWGDCWPTVLFSLGMIACAKWPLHLRRTCLLTLATVCGYLVCFGVFIRP